MSESLLQLPFSQFVWHLQMSANSRDRIFLWQLALKFNQRQSYVINSWTDSGGGRFSIQTTSNTSPLNDKPIPTGEYKIQNIWIIMQCSFPNEWLTIGFFTCWSSSSFVGGNWRGGSWTYFCKTYSTLHSWFHFLLAYHKDDKITFKSYWWWFHPRQYLSLTLELQRYICHFW